MANEVNVVIERLENVIREAQSLLKQLKTTGNGSVVVSDEGESVERKVTKYIQVLGIPANIKGYQYMRTAILLSLEDSTMIHNITRKLYPSVAEMYGTTSSRVERAIRHAIEVACDRGNPDILDKMFGYTMNLKKGKPTNGECIAMIVDILKN